MTCLWVSTPRQVVGMHAGGVLLDLGMCLNVLELRVPWSREGQNRSYGHCRQTCQWLCGRPCGIIVGSSCIMEAGEARRGNWGEWPVSRGCLV